MSYQAKDGKVLPSVVQGRKYDRSLAERGEAMLDDAPGGLQHEADLREHGTVSKAIVENDGPGRWRMTAHHADGYQSTSVHPEAHRAHQVAAQYLGIEPPPALATHQRSRAAGAVGPKEEERIAKEDQREGASRWEDFEER